MTCKTGMIYRKVHSFSSKQQSFVDVFEYAGLTHVGPVMLQLTRHSQGPCQSLGESATAGKERPNPP